MAESNLLPSFRGIAVTDRSCVADKWPSTSRCFCRLLTSFVGVRGKCLRGSMKTKSPMYMINLVLAMAHSFSCLMLKLFTSVMKILMNTQRINQPNTGFKVIADSELDVGNPNHDVILYRDST